MKPPTCLCLFWLAMIACAPLAAADEYTDSDLFDSSFLHEIRLYFQPTDWQTLKDNYLENTYYPVQMVWRGMLIPDVGIRSRGRTTRNPVKPCLRIDFNRFVQDQKFLGLSSLVLDNAWQDPSFVREAMAMSVFRKMGIPAPREAFAQVYVNDEYAGVFIIVEDVVKKFLKRNYDENDGWLYDYHWLSQYRFEYLGPELERYGPDMFEPVTHDTDPDYAPLVDMIRTMNEASDEEFAARMAEYIDLKKLAAYLAVENFLAGWDGVLGISGVNNFYLYQLKATRKFEFIPWDQDLTFQLNDMPVTNGIDTNVLARRMMQVPEVREAYLSALERLAADIPGLGSWLAWDLERYDSLISASVQEDTNKHFSSEEFEFEIAWQRFFLSYRADFVLAEVKKIRDPQTVKESLRDPDPQGRPRQAGNLLPAL